MNLVKLQEIKYRNMLSSITYNELWETETASKYIIPKGEKLNQETSYLSSEN